MSALDAFWDNLEAEFATKDSAKIPDCDHKFDILDGSKTCLVCGIVSREIDFEWFNQEALDETADDIGYGGRTTEIQGGSQLIRRGHNRNATYGRCNRTLVRIMHSMDDICGTFVSRNVIEKAVRLCGKVNKVKSVRKGNRVGLMSACIYFVAHENDNNITPTRIIEAFGSNKREFSIGNGILTNYMIGTGKCDVSIQTDQAHDYMLEYAMALQLPETFAKIVGRMLKRLRKTELTMRNESKNIVAGCIVILAEWAKFPIDLECISRVCSISRVTISVVVRENLEQLRRVIVKETEIEEVHQTWKEGMIIGVEKHLSDGFVVVGQE